MGERALQPPLLYFVRRFFMTKRIISLFLVLVTLLGVLTVPAGAASSLEEAMKEVNIYARNEDLDWLTMNGSVKTQHYTY